MSRRLLTKQILVSIGTVGVLSKQAKNNHLVTSFKYPDLSCPALLQILRAGRIAAPIFHARAHTTCFRARTVILGVRTMGDVIWETYALKTLPDVGVNKQFQAKRRDIKIAISPKL